MLCCWPTRQSARSPALLLWSESVNNTPAPCRPADNKDVQSGPKVNGLLPWEPPQAGREEPVC